MACSSWSLDEQIQEILNTPDDSDTRYFIVVDLWYPHIKKEKTKKFPFCPQNKNIHKDKYNENMKQIKPKHYKKSKKLICDWTDKKNCLVHYRRLKFFVRLGMVVDKVHEIISFKQSKWLENYKKFFTQKNDIELKMILKKTSIYYSIKLSMEKR